ncbi:hypothetical protein [Luteimonas granuli]|uniref:Uncharacterized protein n=1 Tax=Luteimonas granuli TaxID=1176533 RepID=A0A518N2D4_9GAMM|nr:hypothetical protein [Luteimonas granuli]QDW66052.1 hypothetical protein FPZ22_03365 [Luteimonas granuli]
MKAMSRVVLSAIPAMVLAGCASSGGMASAAPQPYQAPDEVTTDTAYVAAVEHVARRRGVRVHWLNPPLKRLAVGPPDEPDVQ